MLRKFCVRGRASFIIGGQFGSEGKGAAAAFAGFQTRRYGCHFDIVTTNAAAQAGHTSIVGGVKRVAFHMPSIPFGADPDKDTIVYLNAGAIIDPSVLMKELHDHWSDSIESGKIKLCIHPNAAVITDEHKALEGASDSAATKIASTRKGVGEALISKVRRSGMLARDCPALRQFIRVVDLNMAMMEGSSVGVEIPQGQSLSLNGKFWPNVTSRAVSIGQAMADADVHPSFVGNTLMVLRTFPIRVGNIVENGKELGNSGSVYDDQEETDWHSIGVMPEITTVTKRIRRVFTWSPRQIYDSMASARPDHVMITFCDYGSMQHVDIANWVNTCAHGLRMDPPEIFYAYGPRIEDVSDSIR